VVSTGGGGVGEGGGGGVGEGGGVFGEDGGGDSHIASERSESDVVQSRWQHGAHLESLHQPMPSAQLHAVVLTATDTMLSFPLNAPAAAAIPIEAPTTVSKAATPPPTHHKRRLFLFATLPAEAPTKGRRSGGVDLKLLKVKVLLFIFSTVNLKV
jgi:hypothetical protein